MNLLNGLYSDLFFNRRRDSIKLTYDNYNYINSKKIIIKPLKNDYKSKIILSDDVKELLHLIFDNCDSIDSNKVVLYLFIQEIINNQTKFQFAMNEIQINVFIDELNQLRLKYPQYTYWSWNDFLRRLQDDTCLCFNSDYKLNYHDIVTKDDFSKYLISKGINDNSITKISNDIVNKPKILIPSTPSISTSHSIRLRKIQDEINQLAKDIKGSKNDDIIDRVDQRINSNKLDMDRPELMKWDTNDKYADTNKLIEARYIEISIDELNKIKSIINRKPSDEILTNKFNIEMSVTKIQCLRPCAWLNDEVINFYMSLLQERDRELCKLNSSRKPSHYFTSYFMERLLVTDSKYNYVNIKRWSKKFDIFTLDKVYFPINISNSHWTLAVIFIELKEIHYYDSMNGAGSKYLNGLLQYIIDEGREKKNITINKNEWKLVSQLDKTPQQENGYDCGMFSLICADFLTDSLPITTESYNQDKMSYFRKKVFVDILRGSLTYPLE